jgi:transglutaminase-like putative cysteine protease
MPLSDSEQTCLDFRVRVEPHAGIFAYDDRGGRIHFFNVRGRHSTLRIEAESLVATHRRDPFASLDLDAGGSAFYMRNTIRQRNIEYLLPSSLVPLRPECDRIAAAARRQSGPGTASFLLALTRLLRRVATAPAGYLQAHPALQEAAQSERRLCLDLAHLMIEVCRRQAIPARFVTGYMLKEPDAAAIGLEADQRREPSADEPIDFRSLEDAGRVIARDDGLHAWVECLLPDERWRGFDPMNDLVVNDSYVAVRIGRDYSDVPPVRSLYRGFPNPVVMTAVRVVPDASD